MTETSGTDRLITKRTKSNANSSQHDLKSIGIPSGTYSTGIDVVLEQNNSLLLIQAKNGISGLTQGARNFLKRYKNKKQAAQANRVLESIENLLKGYDDLDLPEIRILSAKDRSLGLSWRFKDALFGVAIQPDTSESSWFLSQGNVATGFKADGYLDDDFYENKLPSLLDVLRKSQN